MTQGVQGFIQSCMLLHPIKVLDIASYVHSTLINNEVNCASVQQTGPSGSPGKVNLGGIFDQLVCKNKKIPGICTLLQTTAVDYV